MYLGLERMKRSGDTLRRRRGGCALRRRAVVNVRHKANAGFDRGVKFHPFGGGPVRQAAALFFSSSRRERQQQSGGEISGGGGTCTGWATQSPPGAEWCEGDPALCSWVARRRARGPAAAPHLQCPPERSPGLRPRPRAPPDMALGAVRAAAQALLLLLLLLLPAHAASRWGPWSPCRRCQQSRRQLCQPVSALRTACRKSPPEPAVPLAGRRLRFALARGSRLPRSPLPAASAEGPRRQPSAAGLGAQLPRAAPLAEPRLL